MSTQVPNPGYWYVPLPSAATQLKFRQGILAILVESAALQTWVSETSRGHTSD
jgi:hypothetical protein